MSRTTVPNKDEMKTALEAAERMKESNVDPHRVAHCLLYLSARHQGLERLLEQTDRYLRFGMGDRELSALRKTVDKLRADAVERNEKVERLPI